LGGSATFGNVLTYIYQTRSSPDYLYHIFRSRFNFDIRAATIYSEDVANLYLGIKFGYAIEGTADFELIRKPENQPDPEYEREGSSFFHWGIYWGWRIFFTKNIGWYGELGYDNIWELLGILCTGITLKF
jgi:hypothetical protein